MLRGRRSRSPPLRRPAAGGGEAGEAAQAGVAAANENVQNARADGGSGGELRAAVANRDRAAKDLERYKLLIAKDEIPRQQFDKTVTAAQSAQAQVESAEAAVAQASPG